MQEIGAVAPRIKDYESWHEVWLELATKAESRSVRLDYRAMRELVCARSVTARIFTAREGGEQHCQVGNRRWPVTRSSTG